jgi:hypothetical protein
MRTYTTRKRCLGKKTLRNAAHRRGAFAQVNLFVDHQRNQPMLNFSAVSHDAVIRVYDDAGNVIQTHEHKGDFKEW